MPEDNFSKHTSNQDVKEDMDAHVTDFGEGDGDVSKDETEPIIWGVFSLGKKEWMRSEETESSFKGEEKGKYDEPSMSTKKPPHRLCWLS